MKKNILGSVIKNIRKNKKMTQKDLSKLTGFSQNTISNHENGNRSLDEDDIRKYASALNVTPEYLFERVENTETKFGHVYEIYENFGEISKNRIDELNIDYSQVAHQLSISKTKLTHWLDGNYGNAPVSKLVTLCQILNISPRHLQENLNYFESYEEYYESEKMFDNLKNIFKSVKFASKKNILSFAEKQLVEQNNKIVKLQDFKEEKQQLEFPWKGYVSAGTGEYMDGETNETIFLYEDEIPDEADFALTINGDSMKPMFKDHETIFVKKTKELQSGSIGIVIVNDEAYIKKIYYNQFSMTLVSLNSQYEDIQIGRNDVIKFIGKVIL